MSGGPAVAVDQPQAVVHAGEFEIHDLQGRVRSLSELRGQPVLVNYWASWCGPCVKEMPELQRFSQAGHGVRVLGIANDEREAVTAFLQRVPVTFPVWVETLPASGLGSASRFHPTGGALPFSVLLDAQGRVIRSKLGAVTVEELEAWVAQAGPALQRADAAVPQSRSTLTGH